MNEIDSIVRMQVDALMELVEQSRSTQCNEAREQAELQAAELRRQARKLARVRVGKAAREERERLEHEVRMVEAEVETERRRQARRRDVALIAAGRKALAKELAARWAEPDERQAWTERALHEAADVLLGRTWTLEHPADWPADEQHRAIEVAREQLGATIETRPADGLQAGLRIRHGGALVDMSIAGLLANERSIEGELLAECNRVAQGEQS